MITKKFNDKKVSFYLKRLKRDFILKYVHGNLYRSEEILSINGAKYILSIAKNYFKKL